MMSQLIYLKDVVTLRLDQKKCMGCGMCLCGLSPCRLEPDKRQG